MNKELSIAMFLCLFLHGNVQKVTGQLRGNESRETPNIIFILTDDQRWSAMGYAGNPNVKTPEMDKLAEHGTYFKNAIVTTPICSARSISRRE